MHTNKDVLRLNITINNMLTIQVSQYPCYLGNMPQCPGFRKPGHLLQVSVQLTLAGVLKDDEGTLGIVTLIRII